MVPIRLDALSIETDQPISEARANFTRLPYSDETQDVNGDVAYISEEIVSQPLHDQALYLKAGIHLHWALPDSLTKGVQTPDGTDFPAVPNRWLVIRSRHSVIEKKWIVESDYVYPDGAENQTGSISIPVTPDKAAGKHRPFRFLGRKLPLEAWQVNDNKAEYLEKLSTTTARYQGKLTAVGYGEPSFAAFYPNCHSVFGFHDDDYIGSLPDGLQYDVIGWHNDPGKDCLGKLCVSSNNQPPSSAAWVKSLEKQFGWTVALEVDQTFPTQLLCYTRLTFNSKVNPPENTVINVPAPAITIANTGTEALSAYLAYILAETGADAGQTQDSGKVAALKSDIEDQLEALSLFSRLDNRQLDVGPKFQEARHEKGFTARSGGALWTITPQNADISPADANDASAQAQITLPDDMAQQLNQVNRLQQDFDRAQQEIESLRRQLFSDWYKYLLCAYPPDDARDNYPNADEARNYIESKGVAPLHAKLAATEELILQADDKGKIKSASSSDLSPNSLAFQLATTLNELLQSIEVFNNTKGVKDANLAYLLKPAPAPRYYQPNDPVVMLTGAAVKPSLRHGQDGRLRDDGLLECQLLTNAEIQSLIPGNLTAITARIDEIKNHDGDSLAFSNWTEQPWNPFLLEWEAEVFPVESQGNLKPESGNYLPEFINSNFTLDENDVDFSVREGKGFITKAANVYTGSSILTPHAGIQLKSQLEAYLTKQLLNDYYTARQTPLSDKSDDYLSKHSSDIFGWYREANCHAGGDALAVCHLMRAYEQLTGDDFHTLSQSLGGFNEALLMHKQTLQLDIADPLGFDDYQSFAKTVQDGVRDSMISAPQPLNDFNPIRCGAFKLLRLRLVDTFGQVRDLDCSQVMTTEKLNVPGSPYAVSLPPRLTQPTRINLRWLSASADEQEMNDHPASSPICGWVLANNLDNSLMIYDSGGKSLGVIDQQAKWRPAPGSDAPLTTTLIRNPHLKKMVFYLLNQGATFLQDFISALDNALENIEPENFAQHQDIALLMGRPIALVRASVNLELQGLPALHQGWNVFRQDLRRNQRQTNNFEYVRFPIRLGEYRQFNDGMVGYWKETGDDYERDLFYAPQCDQIKDEHIKTHADDPMTIYQTVTAPPQILTILMDPRGSVHATSGVVPVKAISIPPDQYTDALKAIEITFLSAPILTDFGKLRLPLPVEPGFKWSWLQKERRMWSVITSPGVIRKQIVLDAFKEDGEAIWSSLQAHKWIALIDNMTATIMPRDRRDTAGLESTMAAQAAQIESLLDKTQIGAVNPGAIFSGPQEILEGWLKLNNA